MQFFVNFVRNIIGKGQLTPKYIRKSNTHIKLLSLEYSGIILCQKKGILVHFQRETDAKMLILSILMG